MAGAAPVFTILHVNHFLLAIVTIVGLHMTGVLWDIAHSIKLQAADDLNKADALKGDTKTTSPTFFLSGAMWAVIILLLGIIALFVLIVSCFKLPTCFTTIIKWYYLVAVILILFVASFGLGYSPGVEAYGNCVSPGETKEQSGRLSRQGGQGYPDYNQIPDYNQHRIPDYKQHRIPDYRQPSASGSPSGSSSQDGYDSANKALNVEASQPYNCFVKYGDAVQRYYIFVISFLHAMLYLAAFLLACFDSGSSSTSTSTPRTHPEGQSWQQRNPPPPPPPPQEARTSISGQNSDAVKKDGEVHAAAPVAAGPTAAGPGPAAAAPAAAAPAAAAPAAAAPAAAAPAASAPAAAAPAASHATVKSHHSHHRHHKT